MNPRDVFGLAFRVIGGVFLLLGSAAAVFTLVFVMRAVHVAGTVIDYEIEQNAIAFLATDEATGLLYYPVVEYRSPDGERLSVTGRAGRMRRVYEIGEPLGVLMSPDQPANARVDTVFGVWGSAIILGGLGALFVLISLLAPHGFGGRRRGFGGHRRGY